MKTIHIVFNAHIDPIWLWPWQSGLDEALATCRSACDRLDNHPNVIFTRGEAWIYDEIERTDPELFARIQKHVRTGQWEVAGGWWLQPDCNLPSGFAMERQITLGQQYFTSRFGFFPQVAYNVDSFGHSAALPGLMHAHGQNSYVMMRPQPAEMKLPANIFRWRGYEDGPEVITFRIVNSYNLGGNPDEKMLDALLKQLPNGIDHTMLFAGIGDHGGGPAEKQIQWMEEHQNDFEGIKLVFSSPSRFFDAIQAQRDSLPLVIGELQQHAIGCYSVYRPIKTGVRKAEHLLRQAEIFEEIEPECAPEDANIHIRKAWEKVCFAQFHDILGGTCLPSSYAKPLGQLGAAQDIADTLLQEGLRRKLCSLPDDPMQRIVIFNASDMPFDGPVEYSPWIEGREWDEKWELIDENEKPVPYQIIAHEALAGRMPNLLFPIRIDAGCMRILRIVYDGNGIKPSPAVIAAPHLLSATAGACLSETTMDFRNGIAMNIPQLMLYEDDSDTWSHGLDRFNDQSISQVIWNEKEMVDQGPLMASWIQRGVIGVSNISAEWRVHGDNFVQLQLIVNWREHHKLLKLVQPLPFEPENRADGIMGGWLKRPFDGRELPIRDGIIINDALGIATPDVYGVDATKDRIRFTLLRSAIMAHHAPHNGKAPRRTFTDQGEHTFTFRFFAGASVTPSLIDRHAIQMQRPLIIADFTRGMPNRFSS
jgi:alpha-mannosidase